MTAWMELETPEAVAHEIVELYEDRGSSRYDEAVSQAEHGLQCASLALRVGATTPVVVAALLHDIGHLLLREDDGNRDFLKTDLHHEEVGSRFLANWFGGGVTEPIRLHVPAKRYLVATDPTYHAGLSDASARSLVVQGGPMSPDEVAAFRGLPGSAEAVELRRWDDLAKVADAPTPDLDYFRPLLTEIITVPKR